MVVSWRDEHGISKYEKSHQVVEICWQLAGYVTDRFVVFKSLLVGVQSGKIHLSCPRIIYFPAKNNIGQKKKQDQQVMRTAIFHQMLRGISIGPPVYGHGEYMADSKFALAYIEDVVHYTRF